MKRLILAVLLAALCAGRAPALTREDVYWRLHRERNATTRYGAPPTAATNSLTAGFRLLEYVESTGAQWIDTGVSAVEPFLFRARFALLSSNAQNNSLFGCYASNNRMFITVSASLSNGKKRVGIGHSTSWRTNLFDAETNRCYDISVNFSSNFWANVDGVRKWTYSDALASSPSQNLFLFNRSGNSNPSKARVYEAQIVNSDGKLIRDFQPVLDGNGVAGLWDRVSGTMFYSATSTPLVAGPELRPATVLPTVSRETVREMLAPAPTGEPPELAGGDLWLDCLAIPEGNWLCECPIAGTTNTAWRAALCPSNILRAVVWRHAVGLAPTNLPVTLEHDPSRVIGRIERLYYEAGTGVVARISITQAGYAWAVSNHCAKPSPDVRAMYTNLVVRTDGWTYEHQDYIDARCVPRGEDMSSVTNVPAGVQALVMAPVYLRGLSLVSLPLLPTYIEYRVPDHLRDVYPIRPPRQWDWRNGY